MPQIQPIEDDYQPRLIAEKTDRLVVLSGCSGGGKSSLLTELGRRGFGAFEEPGRQVVKEQIAHRRRRPALGECRPVRRADRLALDSSHDERGPQRPAVVLRPRDHRSGRRAQAHEPAGAAAPPDGRRTPPLSRAGVRGAALAGDLRQRQRTPAQFRRSRGELREPAPNLRELRLSRDCPAQGDGRSPRRFHSRTPRARTLGCHVSHT